jgi:hypothetical protein
MTVQEILEGILRLSVPTQRRLLRCLHRSQRAAEHLRSDKSRPSLKWPIARDPIYYTWRMRLDTLSAEERSWLADRLKREWEENRLALFTYPYFDVPYEAFIEARRAVWRRLNEVNEDD